MDEIVIAGMMIASFALGWIGAEAYMFYRHSKKRRWKDG